MSETHTLHVKLVDNPRLGPSPDPEWMAGMWWHWLVPQLSVTLQVLPCPFSRTELVATWQSPANGPRHAFRFLGGVVLPTRETVGELAHNLLELAHGHSVRPDSLLRPEPLHFEQVLEVLEELAKRDGERLQESLGKSRAEMDRQIWEGTETPEERERREGAVPPGERGGFLQGIVDKLTRKDKAAPTLPAELTLGEVPEGYVLVPGPLVFNGPDSPVIPTEKGTDIARWFMEAQQRVGGIVIDDPVPSPNPDPPSTTVQRPVVQMHRAVVAYVVEAPEPVTLLAGGLQRNTMGLPANQPWAVVSPEASLRALEHLQDYLRTEIRRRKAMEGGS